MITSVTCAGKPESVQTFSANSPKTGSHRSHASASAVSLSFGVRWDCGGASRWLPVCRRLSEVACEGLLVDGGWRAVNLKLEAVE